MRLLDGFCFWTRALRFSFKMTRAPTTTSSASLRCESGHGDIIVGKWWPQATPSRAPSKNKQAQKRKKKKSNHTRRAARTKEK
jgi:hypothetical protein